jgi:hypothetical protein
MMCVLLDRTGMVSMLRNAVINCLKNNSMHLATTGIVDGRGTVVWRMQSKRLASQQVSVINNSGE